MSRFKNQKTFKKDGYKRVFCAGCGYFLSETHLGEKYIRTEICKECKNVQVIVPPRLGIRDGVRGAFWSGSGDSCFTALPE